MLGPIYTLTVHVDSVATPYAIRLQMRIISELPADNTEYRTRPEDP